MKTQKQNTAFTVQNWKKVLILAVVMFAMVGGSNTIFAQTNVSFDYSDYFTYPIIAYNQAITYYNGYISNPYSDAAILVFILGFQYCYENTYSPDYLTVYIFQNDYKVTYYTVE